MLSSSRVKDGEYTKTIYGWIPVLNSIPTPKEKVDESPHGETYMLIKDGKYREATEVLSEQLQSNPQSRAALSLLGYCYYFNQDFVNAADCYEQLSALYPEVEDYQLYYAQCLYRASLYDEAMKTTYKIDNVAYQDWITKLQAAIKYGQDDLVAAKSLVDKCHADDPDTEINLGCLLYKEERYEEALKRFQAASQIIGPRADLLYDQAVCHYRLKNHTDAWKAIGEIVEKGIREHPELSVGMTTEGVEVSSVGNTLTLHETALVEAFNLKAALEYINKNYALAKDALTDMPPRSEEELDSVTLHNQALMNMDISASSGFNKLQYLIQQNPFPPETFANLLVLLCKHEQWDVAADVLADNSHLTFNHLTPYLYQFVTCLLTQQTSPEEAFKKFDEMASPLTEIMRKCSKQAQEAQNNHDDVACKKAVFEFEETLERYIPVLMAQAKIFWDRENYSQVEKIFKKSAEFCSQNTVWKLNVAHVLLMQENKYGDAAGFYEPIVKKHYGDLLSISAVVLANLCVSYVLVSQNDEAEEIMKKLEKEEEQIAYENPEKKIYHLSIVNVVIGTLYCVKGNYDFGIQRVMKGLEPLNKKLGPETWFYAKRCFLSLTENMSKHVITVKDSIINECIQFLTSCEEHGKSIEATNLDHDLLPKNKAVRPPGKRTVTYEARLLKSLFCRLLL
ncbi:Tetratricopeptide repeat protein 30A [Nymphon striatum]|nr:Tetratricopeptide repeat protein 30A [Nymphon striatum]